MAWKFRPATRKGLYYVLPEGRKIAAYLTNKDFDLQRLPAIAVNNGPRSGHESAYVTLSLAGKQNYGAAPSYPPDLVSCSSMTGHPTGPCCPYVVRKDRHLFPVPCNNA